MSQTLLHQPLWCAAVVLIGRNFVRTKHDTRFCRLVLIETLFVLDEVECLSGLAVAMPNLVRFDLIKL